MVRRQSLYGGRVGPDWIGFDFCRRPTDVLLSLSLPVATVRQSAY